MIKKYHDFFLNENIKTEEEIFSLNKEERISYFNNRLEEFIYSDFDDLNIEYNRNKYGDKTEYFPFTEIELELCPLKIKNEYINHCIKKGIGIPKSYINNLKKDLKNKYLDSCAKHARSSYVDLFIIKLFSNKQLYTFLLNRVKNKGCISDKTFQFLPPIFKKFYIDKRIQFNLPISYLELSWIEPKDDRDFYTNYYIEKSIEKGAKLHSEILDLCTDEQKYLYYKKRVDNNIKDINSSFNLKTGVERKIDINKEEFERLKKLLK